MGGSRCVFSTRTTEAPGCRSLAFYLTDLRLPKHDRAGVGHAGLGVREGRQGAVAGRGEAMDPVRTTEPLTPLAYRPRDAAAMPGVGRSTVYQLIADGHLPARKLWATTVIRHCDLAALLDAAPLSAATEAARQAGGGGAK
ncbi:helix-turn-helix domain-containing protein [Methylobacterium sp. J-076]|uniref:helix-turn-helix domain-containing protein n=1 Tax=Methylobacterium sp. J-076 TaxID=2836655 RepID=UPI00391BBDAD